jgi:chorismate mutase
MTNGNATLDDLRGEIDEIDGAIHDLLMRRAALAESIAALKETSARADGVAGAAYLRPGREAVVLRRLVARHSGSFPLPSLVRLWREIMSSLLRLQGPFSVAVFTTPDNPGYWDVARDHYGSTTPMIPCQSPLQVLREVTDGHASVGVLPFPEEGEAAPWWPFVAHTRNNEPRVISRLPFLVSSNGGTVPGRGQVSALTVARLTPEETGEDRSLLTLELVEELSRARLTAALAAVGLAPVWQTTGPSHGGGSGGLSGGGDRGGLYLLETESFVAPDDPRLVKLAEALGSALNRVTVLGAYPAPIVTTGSIHDEPPRRVGAAAGSLRS